MSYVTAIIIGAGQCGLAMSRHLAQRSIDHVILERGKVANSWRTQRWDSLRLLTPNWQSRLPGYEYIGDNPDGYMTMSEVISRLSDYACMIEAPVHTDCDVMSVRPHDDGYQVRTTQGDWHCRFLVLASGACNVASVPAIAQELPPAITSLAVTDYRKPQQLDPGGVLVVGASATGVQLAREIQAAGHQVTLAVGEHVRLPRLYRGKDIQWWLEETGVLGLPHTQVDDLNRARRVPSPQLVGSPSKSTLDINTLIKAGVTITGRVAGLRGDKILFSGSLGNMAALADLKLNRLLDMIDDWVIDNGLSAQVGPMERFAQTEVPQDPKTELDLASGAIKTVLWATGYKPDYSWLKVPVLDRKGRLRHHGGIVDAPGLYAMGLPYMRARKSTLIDGAGDDARFLADHMATQLTTMAA